MPRLLDVTRWLVLIAMVLASIASCDRRASEGGRAASRPAKTLIVTSIYPLTSLTNELVGNWGHVEVQTLLPPGGDLQHLRLEPEQVRLLGRADVVIVVGMGLDTAVEQEAKKRPDVKLLRMADMVDFHAAGLGAASATMPATRPVKDADADPHGAEDAGRDQAGPNPHLWLDPMLTEQFVTRLADQLQPLVATDKHIRNSLQARVIMFRTNLIEMHRAFEERLARVPNKQLATFHDAFDRLAERYGLGVVAHLDIELTPGGEVAPERRRQVMEAVRKYDLRVIYVDPRFPDAGVRWLNQDAKVRVLRLDDVGRPEKKGYNSYMALMKSNVETLAEGQSVR